MKIFRETIVVEPPQRSCTKCDIAKSPNEFNKHPQARDGLQPSCRACQSAYNKRYYPSTSEHQKQKSAKYRAENPGYADDYAAAYREKFPDKIQLANEQQYAKNAERNRAYAAKRRKELPEKVNASIAKRKARLLAHLNDDTNLDDLLLRDGPNCYLCGKLTDKNLPSKHPLRAVMEHVVPICRGGAHNAENLRVAHHQCNAIKGSMPLEKALIVIARRLAREPT